MKKFLATILSAATLSVASPAIAQVGPGYVPAYSWSVCLSNPRTSVNVRLRASTSSRSLGQLRHGERVIPLSRFVSADGMYWVLVRSRIGIGYVRDDYTCVY